MTEQIKLAISRLHPGQLALLWVVFGVLVSVGVWQYQASNARIADAVAMSASVVESYAGQLPEDLARMNVARAIGDTAKFRAESAGIAEGRGLFQQQLIEHNRLSAREERVQKGVVGSLGVLLIALVAVTWTWFGWRLHRTPTQR
jgi:hypothetical protein